MGRADDDVAQLARARCGAVPVDREGEDVGRPRAPAELAVERRDPVGVDVLDRDVARVDPGRGEGDPDDALDLGARRRLRPAVADDLDLEHGPYARRLLGCWAAGRSS